MGQKLYATERLAAIRKDKNLTQAEMAWWIATGLGRKLTPAAYGRWESGKLAVPPDTAIRIAKLFKVEANELWRTA